MLQCSDGGESVCDDVSEQSRTDCCAFADFMTVGGGETAQQAQCVIGMSEINLLQG